MTKIAIATNSLDKINGIKVAFTRFLKIKETELEVFHCSVNSKVSDQPFDEETYQGAFNRVEHLINSVDADFYVSCEAGIESITGLYFNVHVVCVFDNKLKKYYWGKSCGWQVPSKDILEIRNTNLDSYLKSKGINRLEDLLGTGHTRAIEVQQATETALITIDKL